MKILFLLCLIAGIILVAPMAQAADWVRLRESNIGTAYYDRADIRQLSKTLVKVSVKYIYSPEGTRKFREAFPNVDGSEMIGYTLYVYQIDCSEGSFRLTDAATYDSSGSVVRGTELHLSESGQSTPEHITPDSMMDQHAKASCKWIFHSP